ncbi:MAG TPA: hypothetical protein VHW23_03760 [Kofleriaceae bacterium]|nr:hypothetical protein [Kofleriaceae bacterium]
MAAAPASARGDSGPAPVAAPIAALAPADDARRAVVIGRDGEVYEPDGKGAWVHRLPCSTAEPVVAAGRAGGAVVALGHGVIYRLAANGWSAIRLVQHGKAILGEGTRSLAAVGRQLFALDGLTRGEPTRLVQAPTNIVSIGAGAGAAAIIVATEAGVFRVAGAKLVAVKPALVRPRLLSDRWALVDRAAADLTTGKLTPWPAGLAIQAAAVAPGDSLVAVGTSRAGLELVTVGAGKLARELLHLTGTAVGVVADRAGRAVVALSDGRIAVRDKAGWTVTQVVDAAAADHPGPAPAVSE